MTLIKKSLKSGLETRKKISSFDFDNMLNNLQTIIRSWYFHGCLRSTDSDFQLTGLRQNPNFCGKGQGQSNRV